MLASAVVAREERQRARVKRASSEGLEEEEEVEGCDSGVEGCVGRLFGVLIVGSCTGVCECVRRVVCGGRKEAE